MRTEMRLDRVEEDRNHYSLEDRAEKGLAFHNRSRAQARTEPTDKSGRSLLSFRWPPLSINRRSPGWQPRMAMSLYGEKALPLWRRRLPIGLSAPFTRRYTAGVAHGNPHPGLKAG